MTACKSLNFTLFFPIARKNPSITPEKISHVCTSFSGPECSNIHSSYTNLTFKFFFHFLFAGTPGQIQR